ncbi:MAG: S8 family serine peptidase [Candidatus Krumholzibacteria bacterium]|jgi:hypothetical protein|nr:S8 family serine peptidase [Candidatus Krumholzibacteria bacterium]
MRLVPALAIVLLAAASAAALDTTTRAVGPVLDWSETALVRFDPAWLHVKFVEGMDVALSDGRFVASGKQDLADLNAVLAGARTVRRTFAGDPALYRAWKARGEAASGRTGPDLSLWYDVELPGGRANLAGVLNALLALPEVEIAHPAPECEPAVMRSGSTDRQPDPSNPLPTPDFTSQQQYLYDTPAGLDAPSAWAAPGGRGAGMRFIDVELDWTWDHEDFDPFRQFYLSGGGEVGYADHGTAVLGEIIGMNNSFGVTGFAGDAEWGTVGITVAEWPEVSHYFLQTIRALRPGDVWLIELQMYPPGRDATPMEWLQTNFDVIWTGCWALDVVCIEAGANGSQNLDAIHWNGVFDRSVRDSGAIMVGAGTPYGRVAEWFTNYGSRMDVHAWGSDIVTTGYGDLYNGGAARTSYTNSFGGTSGASPMVTGAALCLQGIAKAQRGQPLTPSDLRQLLRTTAIPHLDPIKDIGPRPDLGAAVDVLLSSTPVLDAANVSGLQVLGAVSPFGGETQIRFRQPASGPARLEIFDVAGRRVRTVAVPAAAAGERHVHWDGRNTGGAAVSSGVYFYRLEAGRETATGRLVKVR